MIQNIFDYPENYHIIFLAFFNLFLLSRHNIVSIANTIPTKITITTLANTVPVNNPVMAPLAKIRK